jgi:beta-lactamase class D
MPHYVNYIAVMLCVAIAPCYAQSTENIGQVFSKYQTEGTIVLSSLKTNTTIIHQAERAQQRFASASTFKILHTLIALEEEVISKNSIIKWDGTVHDIKTWNQDHTLASAFKVSCVWCYQGFAKKISPQTYQTYITDSQFGKLQPSFENTTFWLDGSLKISAVEQVNFLKKLYQHQFRFSANNYQNLQDVMLIETTPDYRLYAKTGWAARSTPQIGWYVGYVETKQDTWFFALNININNAKDLTLRQLITKEVLANQQIIDDKP